MFFTWIDYLKIWKKVDQKMTKWIILTYIVYIKCWVFSQLTHFAVKVLCQLQQQDSSVSLLLKFHIWGFCINIEIYKCAVVTFAKDSM